MMKSAISYVNIIMFDIFNLFLSSLVVILQREIWSRDPIFKFPTSRKSETLRYRDHDSSRFLFLFMAALYGKKKQKDD